MKITLIIFKFWALFSLLFLAWFLFAHIFSTEPMLFHSRKELMSFLFFPLGIVFGLMLTFRWEFAGGLICFTSVVISSVLIPALILNPYFLIIVMPGILLMFIGIKKIRI